MTLQIDKVQQIEGVTVYGDDTDFSIHYLVPEQPRYRLNPDGTPAFRFLKYRSAVDRQNGKKGGAALFDAEFVVPEEKMPKIMEVLTTQVQQEANRRGVQAPSVKIGTITYTKGEVQLFVIGADGSFVDKVHNPGQPSLYGRNITTFMLEFTEDGATFFEQAMQGKGGAVAVVYKLHFWAKLPAITIRAWFNASKFYSFYQTIDVDWNLWAEDDYRETVREQMISSESMGIEPDFGGLTDEKLKTQLRDWAFRTLEDAVERNMIKAIAPVPDDQRKLPDGIEDVTRNISNTQISSFYLYYKENQTVEWNLNPQGQLQNITNLKDKDGNFLKWEDYSKTIDLDDPFFRQLRVDTYVNADFERLPIHSVEVKLLYNGRPMPNLAPNAPEGEVVLRKPDEVGHFASYVDNNNWKYKYSYQVNYKGESRIFQSEEVETDEGNLTIGVDDVGILAVNVSAGDINWNDVDSVLVTLKYEDDGVDPFEDQFTLTKAIPSHLVQEVIFKPMRKSYKYFVKYFMKDGKELLGGEAEGRSENLFIQDPFGGRKTIGIRGVGDFVNRINQVYLDLKYVDEKNENYTQTKAIALSKDTPFFDWSFPVISPTLGKVTYSGTVVFKDGTIEPIPETTATTDTILVPKAAQDVLEVMIVPDLLDWARLRLVKVSLRYEDSLNNINETKDYVLTPQKKDMQTWKMELKDKSKNQFTYKVLYYMTDGTQKPFESPATTDGTIILEIPV